VRHELLSTKTTRAGRENVSPLGLSGQSETRSAKSSSRGEAPLGAAESDVLPSAPTEPRARTLEANRPLVIRERDLRGMTEDRWAR
jgi:hypothetical protein